MRWVGVELECECECVTVSATPTQHTQVHTHTHTQTRTHTGHRNQTERRAQGSKSLLREDQWDCDDAAFVKKEITLDAPRNLLCHAHHNSHPATKHMSQRAREVEGACARTHTRRWQPTAHAVSHEKGMNAAVCLRLVETVPCWSNACSVRRAIRWTSANLRVRETRHGDDEARIGKHCTFGATRIRCREHRLPVGSGEWHARRVVWFLGHRHACGQAGGGEGGMGWGCEHLPSSSVCDTLTHSLHTNVNNIHLNNSPHTH